MRRVVQAGAVPYRTVDGRVEFLLVTSRHGKWIFPKGRVEPGESLESMASQEVEEEAGITGTVQPGVLGSYHLQKEWTDFEVVMFLFHCEGESVRWRDCHRRARRWCSYENARELLKKEKLRRILDAAQERVGAAEALPPR